MKYNRICYLINVPWRHIFQRPHVLALELEKDYECIVIEQVFWKDFKLSRQKKAPKRLVSIFQLPKSESIALLEKISLWYTKHVIKKYTIDSILWISHPSQYKYIPKTFDGLVVYDCMDFHRQLGTKKRIEETELYEDKLIERADTIFVSSNRLYEYVNRPSKTILVRNGFLSSEMPCVIKPTVKRDMYEIAYFGTVSSWFDFPILRESLKRSDHIKYTIIGPVSEETRRQNESNRICFVGPVDHERLSSTIESADALFMPFCLNELILAVDPVKLYEYINYGKCIISVWYPEIDRFAPFVYFYHSEEEYYELITYLSSKGFPVKYSDQDRAEFLEQNGWDNRYFTIKNRLDEMIRDKIDD